MENIDYKADKYHLDRYPEFLNSETITRAWSEFAFYEYFEGKYESDILDFGGGLGNDIIHLVDKSNVWMIEPSDLGKKFAQKIWH